MRMLVIIIFVSLLLAPIGASSAQKGITVRGVRYFSYATFTRIVFEIEAAAPYVLTRTADGRMLLFSAYEGPFMLKGQLPVIHDGVVSRLESKEDTGRNVVLIHLDTGAGDVKDFVLRGPDRIVLDIARGMASPVPAARSDKPVVVVLDAGHGGRDTGIVTARGQEKSLTLELAQAVRKILQRDSHLKVVLTRDKDQALSLDERAGIANAAGATLVVSIHAATDTAERVYILDPDDDLAAQEMVRPTNRDFLSFEAGSEEQENIWGRQQASHMKESGGFGRKLAQQFGGGEGAEPVQAPLAELKAIDAAAAMVEIGMEQDRAKVAESIARGIELYARENR
jgi:N-acetylmuramoyl-L-alanine amidase